MSVNLPELLECASFQSTLSLGDSKKKLLLFNHIDLVAQYWEQLPIKRIFLSVPYLKIMEISGLLDTKPYYALLISETNEIQACFYYQLKLFKAEESINFHKNKKSGGLQSLRQKLKRHLASQIKFRTLVQGNLSVSGPFGHWINPDLKQDSNVILIVAEEAFKLLKTTHPDLKTILLKDYYESLYHHDTNFAQFQIQPAMEMNLDPKWAVFEDYLSDLRSKYRVRYRKARERMEGIEKRHLRPGQLSDLQLKSVYDLYLNRAEISDFNIATLKPDYFEELNAQLQDQCSYWVYLSEDKIIAFMCMLTDGSTLHAHFTGYEDDLNREYDLYLNLLYDIIGSGIGDGVNRICFARTAMEIKSGVGANPKDLYCYMYYDSSISQAFIPSIVKYLEPGKDWNNRTPFKN